MTRAKRVLRGVDRLMTWLGCALLVNNIRMRLVYRFNKRGAERLPFDKRGVERLPFDMRGAERLPFDKSRPSSETEGLGQMWCRVV